MSKIETVVKKQVDDVMGYIEIINDKNSIRNYISLCLKAAFAHGKGEGIDEMSALGRAS